MMSAAVGACSSGPKQADLKKSSGFATTETPRATAICTDFNGKLIYNQQVDFENSEMNGQVAVFRLPGSKREEAVKGSCTVTAKYYTPAEEDRVKAYRASQPIVATLTNGIDSISLSEKFTTFKDAGSSASEKDGLVVLNLKAANGAILESVVSGAPNIIVTHVSTKPAYEVN